MLELDQRHAEALRLYQRAFRYDPEAVSIARAIIPLAIRLKRHAEAVRYALLAAELEGPVRVQVLRLLADRLAVAGRVAQANRTLAQADALAQNGGQRGWLDLVRGALAERSGDHDDALRMFSQGVEALQQAADARGVVEGLDCIAPRLIAAHQGECLGLRQIL